MKQLLLVVAAVLLLGTFVCAQVQDTHLSQHDFAVSYGGGVQTFQGCRGCHIPHGGSVVGDTTQPQRNTLFGTATVSDYTTGQYILWDKLLSTGAFQTYSSSNPDLPGGLLAPPASSTDPAWHSYLCFSCHDGTTAGLNIPSGLVATDNFLMNGGNGDIDLTNDHPIDMDWPTANTGYETIANVTGGTSGQVGTAPMPLYGTGSRVECSTCHNPHFQPTASNGNRGNFLRMTAVTDNTSFCRACHLDKR